MILILDMILLSTLNLSLYHLIGIIGYYGIIDIITSIDITTITDTVGVMVGI
jgi:hypothetical protein|tara:strand:- start:176 stop:331 length:156 start_codon:yes stop_codon:yes gene_type:complete